MLLLKLRKLTHHFIKYMSLTLVCQFQLVLSLELGGVSKLKKIIGNRGTKEGAFFSTRITERSGESVRVGPLPGEAVDIPHAGMKLNLLIKIF